MNAETLCFFVGLVPAAPFLSRPCAVVLSLVMVTSEVERSEDKDEEAAEIEDDSVVAEGAAVTSS